MYILRRDTGHLELVESAFKDPRAHSKAVRVPSTLKMREETDFHSNGDDEMVNDEEIDEEMHYEDLCESGDCKDIPPTNLMKIKASII